MLYVKIWWSLGVNIILLYLIRTITANNTNNVVDILEKNSNDVNNCCLDRKKKAINDKLINNIKTVADGANLIADNSTTNNIKERLTVERNAYPNIVARKGVYANSISARKGVENITTQRIITESMNLNEEKEEYNENNSMKVFTNPPELIPNENSTAINFLANSTIIQITNTTKKKFRPKPTATVVGIDDDNSKKFIHGSPTKSPPLGMPKKINYVVPVLITILILPFFVISMIYIYKNGRDCWEKRHYRRMDFLIDGMYNE